MYLYIPYRPYYASYASPFAIGLPGVNCITPTAPYPSYPRKEIKWQKNETDWSVLENRQN